MMTLGAVEHRTALAQQAHQFVGGEPLQGCARFDLKDVVAPGLGQELSGVPRCSLTVETLA